MRGIEYRDDGSIVVYIDKPYPVETPNGDTVLKWEEEILDNAEDVRDQFTDYRERLAALDENTTEHRELQREFNKWARSPHYDFNLDWLERAFTQYAQNFPPRGEWPAFLLNVALPVKFSNHWKTVPLVSGEPKPKPPTPQNNG